jgi:hypothetical protein
VVVTIDCGRGQAEQSVPERNAALFNPVASISALGGAPFVAALVEDWRGRRHDLSSGQLPFGHQTDLSG